MAFSRPLYLLLAIFIVSIQLALTVPSARDQDHHQLFKRDSRPNVGDEVEEYFNDIWQQLWGGRCLTDGECADIVAKCYTGDSPLNLIGECRMTWWFLLILAVIACALISSIISCICCPCCCLYECCMNYICCCCRRRGYEPANRG